MTEQANKHRRDKEFDVGDFVLLRLQQYRQKSVANMGIEKLSRRYDGPFKILERIGKVAYRLELPAGACIHLLFHVSLIRGCYREGNRDFIPLPPDLQSQAQAETTASLEDKAVSKERAPDTFHA
ncbi:uncharacterized protein LOC143635384 [Bidens hawaiensis]|uniref:uncharacterized protein LOC143635384 n=1 Tax=Bidens hawaiensis TaxID=980011 RepID=UPI00404B2798